MFKIETGKRIPPPKTTNKYPFKEMAVGDSFLIPCKGINEVKKAQVNVHGSARKIRIATRKEDGGLRVWRTE